MAYPEVTGTNPRKLPKYRNMFSKDWQALENLKVQGIVNDGATIDVVQINVTQEDRDALKAGQELRAIVRIDFVPYNTPVE